MAFSMNGQRKGPMAEINVTPLVDVMLVLLIIFMVTAPMMQEGVSVDLPETSGSPITQNQQQKEVIISVTKGGKIHLNEKEVQESNLLTSLKEITQNKLNRDVYLRADKSVEYGTVVRIIGTLKRAGITNLGMITTPERGPTRGK
jgi:biopolymer transport protein TolR